MLSRGLEEHINLKGKYGIITAPLKNGQVDEAELKKRILESYDPSMQGLIVNGPNGQMITYISLQDINAMVGKACDAAPKFQGGYGIVLTPFQQNGQVDYIELKKQLEAVCRSDIRGVVVCGSTSEFTYLSREETKEIMTFSKNIVKNKKEFICGATAANCHETKELLKFIERLGADGALVAPPYYFPMSDNDVLDFYTEIASEPGNLPIIAYQIPQCTSGISMNVYQELLKLPRIQGIKNSSGNVLQIMQQIILRNEVRKDFAVLTGSDESIYALVNCGANGSFTAIGYLYPNLIANIYKNLKNEKGLHYQEIVVKLASLAGSIPYPLGYRILGEASGNMNFGKYMQAVSSERMQEYQTIKCRMQDVLKQIQEN